jgi:hypothetical protein
MLAYVNSTSFNIRKEIISPKPEDLPEKSMIRQNAKLWYKVAQLHLRDLEDMENSIAVLQKSWPLVPNQNMGKIPVHAQYVLPPGANVIDMHAFTDTSDHLLSLGLEKAPFNLQTSSVQGVPEPTLNVTSTRRRSKGPTITKQGGTKLPEFIGAIPDLLSRCQHCHSEVPEWISH